MAQAGGIDATLGPCNIPHSSYTPVDPANRYVAPDVYMRLVQLNATVGMKTVVYDARLYSGTASTRDTAIAFWTPVLANRRVGLARVRPRSCPCDVPFRMDENSHSWGLDRVPPFVNFLPRDVLDNGARGLPGVERVLSFDNYDVSRVTWPPFRPTGIS